MKSVAHPSTREARGIKLFKERGDAITRVYPHVYRVPSCSGETFYTVHLAPRERCDCPDHQRHPKRSCKHIICATIYRAKSRARVAS